jgi:hypothetical protein
MIPRFAKREDRPRKEQPPRRESPRRTLSAEELENVAGGVECWLQPDADRDERL